MAQEFIYVQGKVKWFRNKTPDKFDKYAHALYPANSAELDKLKNLQIAEPKLQGIKNTLRKDDDGYYMNINRPARKNIRGVPKAFAPPTVVDKDGRPFDGLVGNGSDVTTKIEVYKHSLPGLPEGHKARAIRWDSTRIDNLIPYERNDNFPEDNEARKDLDAQPPQF